MDSVDIDKVNTMEVLKMINDEDKKVAFAVEKCLPEIEKATNIMVERIKNGGRVFISGAGTSGRVAVMDATEWTPTFGVSKELCVALMAGGATAVADSKEDAEDSFETGAQDLINAGACGKDVLIAVAASGRTPYPLGALDEATKLGMAKITVTNNPDSDMSKYADVAIEVNCGPEVLLGSTRMKSGTAQKMVLNMLSTATMIRCGKTYSNLMVDLSLTNIKLVDRARRLVQLAIESDEETASKYLEMSGNYPKLAVVMYYTGASKEEAEKLLDKTDGYTAKAIELGKK